MKDMIETMLAGLSELVYVSSIDTYELLYVNEAGRKIFGEEIDRAGRKCYEVLQGFDAPCPFCTNECITFDTFYEWKFRNSLNGRVYLLRDKLCHWHDQVVRLEIAFDITDEEREKEAFRFLAETSDEVVECIKVLDGEEEIGVAIDRVLARLGAYLGADRTYVFEFAPDGVTMSNTHEWCREGVSPEIENLQNMPISLISSWCPSFKKDSAVVIEDVEALGDDRAEERETLMRQQIHSLAAVALEADGCLIGYLGVDNPPGDGLATLTSPLKALAYFVSAGIKRAADKRYLEELTWGDKLTHVGSRAAFRRDYDCGSFEHVNILVVDVDRLNAFNISHGREAGDSMLVLIGRILTDVFGEGAVYRTGDDEFCAVRTDVGYADFAGLVADADRCLNEAGVPASLGFAGEERCESTLALLETADARMRSAKRARARAFSLGVDLAADAAVSAILQPGGAQKAVSTGAFSIYLMPQISCETGEIVSAETLIRYHDPLTGAMALPASFIPALEDLGEIDVVDFFALSSACETIAQWRREGRPVVPLAVNFSRRTVSKEGFVARVVETVERYGVEPCFLELELTESAREDAADHLCGVAAALSEYGFRMAIDDFGIDNANVSLFMQLNFDVLKFDRALICSIAVGPVMQCVIGSLARMCSELGIESVAEGVETPEQLEAVRAAGCTRAQGYLVGHPVPLSKFEQKFLSRAAVAS